MPAPSQRYPRVAKYSFVLLSPLQAEEKAQKDEAASKVEDPTRSIDGKLNTHSLCTNCSSSSDLFN